MWSPRQGLASHTSHISRTSHTSSTSHTSRTSKLEVPTPLSPPRPPTWLRGRGAAHPPPCRPPHPWPSWTSGAGAGSGTGAGSGAGAGAGGAPVPWGTLAPPSSFGGGPSTVIDTMFSPRSSTWRGGVGGARGEGVEGERGEGVATPHKGGNTIELPPWKKGWHRPVAPQYARPHFMECHSPPDLVSGE